MKGNLTNSLKQAFATGKLKFEKHSPEIFLAVGIAGTIVGAVVACVATVKAKEVLEETKENLEAVDKATETVMLEKYSEEDRRKDLVKIYVQTGYNLGRLYLPAVALFGLSIAGILHSHGLMKRRNAELLATCSALTAAFNEYRERVRKELGDNKEDNLYYGLREVTVTEGNEENKDALCMVEDPISPYAVYFGPDNACWEKGSLSGNKMFLEAHEKLANNKLCVRKKNFIFLNDVYKMIGFNLAKMPKELVEKGQRVGWVYDPERKDLHNYITFNIHRTVMPDGNGGIAHVFLIDPNVDGVVMDLL